MIEIIAFVFGLALLIRWSKCLSSKKSDVQFEEDKRNSIRKMDEEKFRSGSHHPSKKKQDQTAISPEENYFPDNDDMEEEMSAQMTQSYSEISFKSGASPDDPSLQASVNSLPSAEQMLQRPATLSYDKNFPTGKPLNLDGTFHREGNMTHFVADNLEYKIKISSPVSKKGNDTPSSSKGGTPMMGLYKQSLTSQVGLLDIGLLQDLEYEAQRMATSIDSLTENLCEILQSISSLTAQNVDVYKDAVTKMSEAMDSNIKSMYTMMAKAEEVTTAMKGVQSHAQRIKDIRRLVDLFETYL